MIQNIQSFDPSNGKMLGELPRASSTQVDEVIKKAKEAAGQWRKIPLDERLHYIKKAYSAAETSVNRLAELLSREMGKDIGRSTSEVQGSIWGGPYIADFSLEALRSQKSGGLTIE